MKPSMPLIGSAGTIHIQRKRATRTGRRDFMLPASSNSLPRPRDNAPRMFLIGTAYRGAKRMADATSMAVAAISGGVVTKAFEVVSGWLKSKHETRQADRTADAQLEEHKDKLTFDLLTAAQSSVALLQKQVSELLPLMPAAAHLAESLDHIHALLHANGQAEVKAAERRARAFLRRMRPEVGDLRNAVQVQASTKNVINDLGGNS